MLVVDGANVVGARPDGWWKDRAGAARRLHEGLLVADLDTDRVVLVLEGGAKGGVRAGRDGDVLVVHAPRDGDSEIVARTGVTTCYAGLGAGPTLDAIARSVAGAAEAVGTETGGAHLAGIFLEGPYISPE